MRVYRSATGRVLTVGVALVAAAALVATASSGVGDALRIGALSLLATLAAWAVFWRPEVEVSDGGLLLRNVTRTVRVPWPCLRRLDATWALRVETSAGAFSAWAVPARSGTAARLAARRGADLADGSTAPPGESPERYVVWGASAETVAGEIGARWTALRAAGYLDDVPLTPVRPSITWHLGTIGAVVALAALATIALARG